VPSIPRTNHEVNTMSMYANLPPEAHVVEEDIGLRDDGQLTTLAEFCARREMSLRSRVELVEQVCALVVAAHAAGMGFLHINPNSVEVHYRTGGLSMDIEGVVPLPAETVSGGDRRQNPWRFCSADVVKGANVVELGHLLRAMTADLAPDHPEMKVVVDSVTNMRHPLRLTTAKDLHHALVRLRSGLEPGRESHWQAGAGDTNYQQRWTWA
jgi:hypothetical protein